MIKTLAPPIHLGKFQHHAFGKLDRSAPVTVVTHNIRVQSIKDDDDNSIFLDPSVAPWNHEFHPVFRPVSETFFKVVEKRIEKDQIVGRRAQNQVLQLWIDEIEEDRIAGKGMTSFEKVSECMNFGAKERKICCRKCHTIYMYNVNSTNICPASHCKNNPTFYEESESGPFKTFKFPEKPPNTVIVNEVEPLPINPNGKVNLKKLYEELKSKFWSKYESFPFYGDGLPGVSFERMKSEFVLCTTHGVNIQIIDSKLLAEHCKPECSLGK